MSTAGELPSPAATTCDRDVCEPVVLPGCDDAATGAGPGHITVGDDEVGSDVAAARELHISVEAFGSGAVLHADLAVPSNKTVGDLRTLLLSASALPPRTRTLRLFVGHGGIELRDDGILLSETAITANSDEQPLVMFPQQCEYRRRCRTGMIT